MLYLNFVTDEDAFGEKVSYDLKPNGNNIAVTNANKEEYVQLKIEHIMTSGIRQQLDSFLQGFYVVIPQKVISCLSPGELEMLISGTPEIDVEDWRKNTEYRQLSPEDDLSRWFWECVTEMSAKERTLLLQFATGKGVVPLGGFAALRGNEDPVPFTLAALPDALVETLPMAATCFNLLKLPPYSSKAELTEKLLKAISYTKSFALY